MRSFMDAVTAVVKYLDDMKGDAFEIHSVQLLPANAGWVFYYQSKKWMKTRNPLDVLAGNAPVIYDRTHGTLHITGTAEPIEYYIDRFLEKHNSSA